MLNLLSIYLKGTFVFNPILNDAPEPLQISFQDSASPGLEGIIDLHDSIFFYLIVISVGVFWILGSILINFNSHRSPIIYKYLNHGTLIELVWTITPALVLIAIAFPSFKLLYMLDEVISPAMTVKVSGHQWYWSYEYSDFIKEGNEAIEFDSYMVPESDLELGQLRLLDVDNRLVIPIDTHIRFVVTGTDVLHDFAVPALGIKIDAVPGRLNQTSAIAKRAGIFYGQCSEICGTYHGFMPSVVEGVDTENFLVWLDNTASFLVLFPSINESRKIVSITNNNVISTKRLIHSSTPNFMSNDPNTPNPTGNDPKTTNPVGNDPNISNYTGNNLDPIKTDISLNENQVKNFKDFEEIFKARFKDLSEDADSLKDVEEFKNSCSSFNEAFPNFNTSTGTSTNSNNELFELIGKVANAKDKDITFIFNKEGFIKGFLEILSDPQLVAKLQAKFIELHPESVNKTTEQFNEMPKMVEEMKTSLALAKNNVDVLSNKVQVLSESIDNKVDLYLQIANKALDVFMANQGTITVAKNAALMISPVLAYRALLTTYSAVYLPTKPNINTMSPLSFDFHHRQRLRQLTKFNIVALPLLVFYYGSLASQTGLLTGLFPSTPKVEAVSTVTTSILFLSNKSNLSTRIKYIILFGLFILALSIIIPFILKLYFPSLFVYLTKTAYIFPLWLSYLFLILFISVLLHTIAELLLFIYFSSTKKNLKVPNILGEYVKNWVNDIKTESTFNQPKLFLNTYLKSILTISALILIFIYFFIII